MLLTKRNFKKIIKIIVLIAYIISVIFLFEPFSLAADAKSVGTQLRESIAMWYIVARYFSICAMLIILIYLGIQLAINSVASDKAKYKGMLIDWLIGFIFIFIMHYFMMIILKINESLVGIIQKVGGIGDEGLSLYETVRTRAYSLKFTVGTSGAIMYMFLVYYTIKYLVIYIKRYINITILTITAPLMCLMNTFQKIRSGKGNSMNKWFEEYTLNVLIQTVHALIYVLLVSISLKIAEDNIIYIIIAILALKYMSEADELFRKIFKLSGGSGSSGKGGAKEMLEPFKATKALMTGGAVKEFSKDASKVIKRKSGELADRKLENYLDKYRESDKMEEMKKKHAEIDNKKKELNKLTNQAILLEKDNKTSGKEQNKEENNLKREELLKQIKNTKKEINELEDKLAGKDLKGIKKIKAKKSNLDYALASKYTEVEVDENEVDENKKKKIITMRRNVKYDAYGNEKKNGRSISRVALKEFQNSIFGSQQNMKQVQQLAKLGTNTVKGMGQVFVSIPLIVDEPAAGFALLASGIKNAKPLYKSASAGKVSMLEMRNLRKANKKLRKKKMQESEQENNQAKSQEKQQERYTFNRFGKGSLRTIRDELKEVNFNESAERIVGIIDRINNPNLSFKIFTAPLRLTGQARVATNLSGFLLNEAKRRAKIDEKIDKNYTVELVDSVSKEYESLYRQAIAKQKKKSQEASVSDLIKYRKMDIGQITELKNGKILQFKDNKSSLQKSRIVEDVMVNLAIDMKIKEIEKLDLNNADIQEKLISKLQSRGILTQTGEINKEETTQIVKILKERKVLLLNNDKDIVEKTAIKQAIIEIATENEIDSIDELKPEETVELIQEKVIESLEMAEVTEEERVELKQKITEVISESQLISENEEIEYSEDEQKLLETNEYSIEETGLSDEEIESERSLENLINDMRIKANTKPYTVNGLESNLEESVLESEGTISEVDQSQDYSVTTDEIKYSFEPEKIEYTSEDDGVEYNFDPQNGITFVTQELDSDINLEGEETRKEATFEELINKIGKEGKVVELESQITKEPIIMTESIDMANENDAQKYKVEDPIVQMTELESTIASLRTSFVRVEVDRLNNIIKETSETLDEVRRQDESEEYFRDPYTYKPKENIYIKDEIIPERHKEFQDILDKLVEEKQLEYIAKQEYGIRSETKQYKRMQMIYDTQEKKTIESNGHINTIIEELNFNLRKDEEDDENS